MNARRGAASAANAGPSEGSTIRTTTTLVLCRPVVATGGLLSCDDGDFHTITLASADGTQRVVLAGIEPGPVQTVRTALAALSPPSGARRRTTTRRRVRWRSGRRGSGRGWRGRRTRWR